MDMTFLNDMMIPIVVVACLVIGYVFKKWVPADNRYIPTVLAIIGAILGCVALEEISLGSIVGGAISGLASTGLYELFRQFIEKE